VGANAVVPAGEVLTDEENVLRGLNPQYCESGLPTPDCFMLKKKDLVHDGPSFGIENPGGPIGQRQGIPHDQFALRITEGHGVARLSVREALEHVRERGVRFYQKDAEDWGEYTSAHCMISGHQEFTKGQLRELMRHLAKLACKAVLRKPWESQPTSLIPGSPPEQR